MNDYRPHSLDVLMGEPALLAPITRDRVRTWLATPSGIGASGDAGFSDDGELTAPLLQNGKPLRPAAVLILLLNNNHADDPRVLFTQRTAHLTDHAGQISFPGGRVEANDRDAHHTALRETEEETGVGAHQVEILGSIPNYATGTGYQITPVVGWTDEAVAYKPDPTEVAECFEVPLSFLLNPRNHRLESAMYKGRMRSYYAVPYQHRYIWGATAGMLVTLTRVVANALGTTLGDAVRGPPDSGR
jgi:8-oxo-dGTP pyrophosphatase MutT (NUDIX family)